MSAPKWHQNSLHLFVQKSLIFSLLSIPILVMAINGGYFPAICRVCFNFTTADVVIFNALVCFFALRSSHFLYSYPPPASQKIPCKGTKFLYILSPPTPSFSSPHLHFRPPKPFHFMIFIPPTYFRWSFLYVDFIEEVRSGWRSLSILFIVRDFPFLTITCVRMARIMMYL